MDAGRLGRSNTRRLTPAAHTPSGCSERSETAETRKTCADRTLTQQLLARVAAAAHDGVDLRADELLADLATLPGLRGLAARERDRGLAELIERGRLRETGGVLVVGDSPAEWWRVGTVFEGGPAS